jgi:argininosuccinate synthase
MNMGVERASSENKVVLAYSGGLDTAVILKWLAQKSHEVIVYVMPNKNTKKL